MENLIGNAKRIIELQNEIDKFELLCKKMSDVNLAYLFELKVVLTPEGSCNSDKTFYIDDKELRQFIKECVHENYNKRLNKLKDELSQYVISKKI